MVFIEMHLITAIFICLVNASQSLSKNWCHLLGEVIIFLCYVAQWCFCANDHIGRAAIAQ
jgi:hypothetical protein